MCEIFAVSRILCFLEEKKVYENQKRLINVIAWLQFLIIFNTKPIFSNRKEEKHIRGADILKMFAVLNYPNSYTVIGNRAKARKKTEYISNKNENNWRLC